MEKPLSHGVAFSLPGQYAIAYGLLNRWAASKIDVPWAGEDVKTVEIDEGSSVQSPPSLPVCWSVHP